uniref:glycosyltransferase n=1 Tax=Scandinavium goeteborgense TaxID=1851514 RepID=UPI00135AC370|nr:glycosyltransferase [Scandinavium goeteborgense]
MTIPHFSVLMSLYDKEDPSYLEQCLRSLQLQSLLPHQIVIVFDGPISVVLESIVYKYSTLLPINVVRLSENKGLGNALNFGMSFCEHEIIARMDTDDYCDKNRFLKQITFMGKHPEVSILGSAIDEYDESMSIFLGTRKTKENSNDIKKYARFRSPFNHMTVVFRKSKILSIGGYKHHYCMEDYNLWLRAIAANMEFYNFNDSLVMARTGSTMISRRKGLKYIQSEWELARLKYHLKIQGVIGVAVFLIIRTLPRLLPKKSLTTIYSLLRK